MSEITLKQQKAADKYIETGNMARSMLFAGYTENYAKHRADYMLSNVVVKAYIDKKRAELAEKAEITRETQVKELQEISKLAKDKSDLTNMIAANREINKLCGLITDKVETKEVTDYANISPTELEELKSMALRLNNRKARAG